jgi:hypothetical protein
MDNVSLEDLLPIVQQTSLDGEEEDTSMVDAINMWTNMDTVQWINYYGIPESYLNPGFKAWKYGLMT